MSKAIEILKSYDHLGITDTKDYVIDNPQYAFNNLEDILTASFDSKDQIACLEEANLVIAINVPNTTPDNILPISFFKNFKLRVQSSRPEIVIHSWHYNVLKNDNNQYIYQLHSKLSGMVDATTRISLEKVRQNNYSIELLSGQVSFVALRKKDPNRV